MLKDIIKYISLVLFCTFCFFRSTVFAEDTKEIELTYIEEARVSFINELENKTYEYKYKVGDKIIEPNHSNINGYIFAGWFLNDYKWNFYNDNVFDHMILYAKYIYVEGIIKDITIPKENDCNASIKINVEDIPLNDEDISLLNNGKTLNIKLVADVVNSTDINQKEKDLINNKIKETNEILIQYLNIELLKMINGINNNISLTNNLVEVSLQIPEEYRETNKEYILYRIHDDMCEIVFKGRPLDNWMITFKTDKFSTYALSYKNVDTHKNVLVYSVPNTGVEGTILYQNIKTDFSVYLICILLFVFCILLIKYKYKNL